MKKVPVIILFFIIPVAALATQWTSPNLAFDLSDTSSNYPCSILPDGTAYENTDGHLFRHFYNASYSWNSGEQCNFPDTIRTITIHPDGTTALVAESTASKDVRWATSTDGLNWTLGSILDEWNRDPHYPMQVTCA